MLAIPAAHFVVSETGAFVQARHPLIQGRMRVGLANKEGILVLVDNLLAHRLVTKPIVG